MRLPASLREVARTSSSRGWSQTIFAARAPVKPLAPATSTRAAGAPSSGWFASSFTQLPPDLPECGDDRVAHPVDLLVGQGPVGGAELEPQRQALPPLPQLLAFVEVEDAGRAQQLAAGRDHRRAHLLGRHLGGDDDGEV